MTSARLDTLLSHAGLLGPESMSSRENKEKRDLNGRDNMSLGAKNDECRTLCEYFTSMSGYSVSIFLGEAKIICLWFILFMLKALLDDFYFKLDLFS